MRRRIPTLAFTTLGIAAALIGLTTAPSAADHAEAVTEDERAHAFDGNATTCADDEDAPGGSGDLVTFPGSTQFPDPAVAGDASNSVITGDVHDPDEGQFTDPYSADANSLLDVTVAAGYAIDAIVVKAGNAYNVYGPEDAPFTDLRAPLVGGGQGDPTNIPAISHWFVCYQESDPGDPETGDVTLDKVTSGGTAPAADVAFAFTVDCESGTETTPVNVAPNQDPVLVADDVVQGDECTITETGANGATSTSYQVTGGTEISDAGGAVTFTVDGTSVSVVVTNTFPEPVVTPQTPVVQGVQITTTTTAPTTTTTATVAGVQLARTGSPAGFWYLMSGLAFLLGGLSLYGSTARRLLFVKR